MAIVNQISVRNQADPSTSTVYDIGASATNIAYDANTDVKSKIDTKEDQSVELTQEEYERLSSAEKNNGKTYYITDAGGPGGLITGTEVVMTGYTKPSSASAIAPTDTLNAAIGKVEKGLDNKAASSHTHTVSEITDFPTLGTAAAKDSTNAVTSGSTDLVESGAVATAIANAISTVYKPSGDKTVAQLISSLLIADNLGNVYNVTDSGTTTSDFVGGAGKPINIGDNVAIVDVGSSTYKFDLLSGFVDLSSYIQTSNTSGLVKNDGTIDTTTYISDISGKADKVTSTTNGDIATLDSNGNLVDGGILATNLVTKSNTSGLIKNDGTIDTTTYVSDISGKTDKVTNAINGNFAGLDSNGNLTDSGSKASDFLTQHQDISGKTDKVTSATSGNLAGLNASGNLTDSGYAITASTTDLEDGVSQLTTGTIYLVYET